MRIQSFQDFEASNLMWLQAHTVCGIICTYLSIIDLHYI